MSLGPEAALETAQALVWGGSPSKWRYAAGDLPSTVDTQIRSMNESYQTYMAQAKVGIHLASAKLGLEYRRVG